MNSNDIPRDVNSSVQWTLKKKKKESKRDIIKHRKVAGEPHLNHVGRPVSGSIIGEDCRCLRLKCYTKVSLDQRQEIFESFYRTVKRGE